MSEDSKPFKERLGNKLFSIGLGMFLFGMTGAAVWAWIKWMIYLWSTSLDWFIIVGLVTVGLVLTLTGGAISYGFKEKRELEKKKAKQDAFVQAMRQEFVKDAKKT